MELFLSAFLTLVLVMDPVGNMPLFVAHLKNVDERRRPRVVARESLIALLILLVALFFGPTITGLLHINREALHISGGVLLFIISVGMIFPGSHYLGLPSDTVSEEEPFIVPLATPFVAGPSAIATLMIFASRQPELLWHWLAALVAAWVTTAVILLLAAPLSRQLGHRGMDACERLMGMILTVISVQMLLDGVKEFISAKP